MTPLAWVLAFPLHMGLMGIIWGMLIATVAAAGLLVARFLVLARR
jgi:Na+-driven multidrug efflux pump